MEEPISRKVEVYETLVEFTSPTRGGKSVEHEIGDIIIIQDREVLVQGMNDGEFPIAVYSPEFVRINKKIFQRRA